MATNPMQRRSRIAFLIGVLVTVVIAAVIVLLLYMQINKLQEQLQTYVQSTTNVYVLNQDVKSGQVLTADMFKYASVSIDTVPANATYDIMTTLSSYSLCTTDGLPVYTEIKNEGNNTYSVYYVLVTENNEAKKREIYVTNDRGAVELATYLSKDSKAFYYAKDNNTERTNITIGENAVVAKVNLSANTVITTGLITRADEINTSDVRSAEYNIISLPVDLMSEEYVDIRLALPNGQDYLVVSKKKVTVPIVNGMYSPDIIQMNMSEAEILTLSCAIVENYQLEGSKLYAVKYVEAGLQEKAELTYYPNNDVIRLINTDPNIVQHAINNLERRGEIDSILEKYGDEDKIKDKVTESMTSTKEARAEYLQSLTAVE